MKKYILGVFFFLGVLFVSLISNGNIVRADTTATVTTDPYDSRKISIELVGLINRTNRIEVHEVVTCLPGEEGCQKYVVGEEKYFKILTTVEYVNLTVDLSAILDYTITTPGDGEKEFYIVPFEGANVLDSYSCYFTHQLSTLTQRVVVNPDGNGNAKHVYDHIQYSPVRKLSVSVNLFDVEYEKYTGDVYICEMMGEEMVHCGDYVIDDNTMDYYLTSYGDGKKYLHIYLVKKGNSIGDTNNILQELKDEAIVIAKDIYLDTIGPEITIDGGNWVFVGANEKYQEQRATCKDAVFENDPCIATNDYSVVGIDYSDSRYQIITYEAIDKLGNISTVPVKVKVNQEVKDDSLTVWLIVCGGIMLATFTVLGYVLMKNHEKKKKLSYI